MRSVNKVILLGNVTREPDLKYTPSGVAVCRVGLATNRSWTNKDGQKQEEAEFSNIVFWDNAAELITQYVKTGDRLYIEGRLKTNKWEDDNGTTHYSTDIIANDFVLLGKRNREETDDTVVKPKEAEAVPATSSKKEEVEIKMDDIPF